MATTHVPLDLAALSKRLEGLVVRDLVHPSLDSIAVRFTNGATLDISPTHDGFAVVLSVAGEPHAGPAVRDGRDGPTRRQREYLDFIKRYLHRFGQAPAETDIQRHFMVSAPSAHAMVRTLERRGFIQRDRDWDGKALPRSIRVLWDG